MYMTISISRQMIGFEPACALTKVSRASCSAIYKSARNTNVCTSAHKPSHMRVLHNMLPTTCLRTLVLVLGELDHFSKVGMFPIVLRDESPMYNEGHIYVYIYIYIYICVCLHLGHTYTCVQAYIYMHIHIYVHTTRPRTATLPRYASLVGGSSLTSADDAH